MEKFMSEGQGAQSPTRQKFRKIRSLLTSTGFSEEHLVMGAALLATLVLILYAFGAFETKGEVWRGTFGGPGFDVGASALETSGGLVVVGKTNSFGAGGYDGWLLATDSKGREIWNRTVGGPGDDEGVAIVAADDGGYAFAGGTESFGAGGSDGWLVRTDPLGRELWNRTFGGAGDDWISSLYAAGDGGYLLVGETDSFGSEGRDLWLIRTDPLGREVWNRTFGGKGDDVGRSITGTADGGFIITGFTDSFGAGGRDLWLLKADSNGSEVWNVTFGGSRDDVGEAVIERRGGGYVVAGGASATRDGEASDGDAWLIITDPQGSPIRGRILSVGDSGRDLATTVAATEDGGYIVGGWSSSGRLYSWLLKTDGSGARVGDFTIPDSGRVSGSSVLISDDGGYVTCGWTISSGNADMILAKIKM